MVPVNDDEIVPSNEDTVEAPPSSPEPSVESPEEGVTPVAATDAEAPAPAKPGKTKKPASSAGDQWLNRAIWAVVAIMAVVGAIFGYQYYQAQQVARQSNPALEVVDQVRKLVDANPKNAALRIRLGEALAAAGDLNTAKAELLGALRSDPKAVGAYRDLAQIALTENNNADAEIYLTKLLDATSTGNYQNVNDQREFALFSLGELTLGQKRYTDAIGYFNAAIRIRKDASDSYLRLAQAYHGSGDDVSAMKQVDIALQFDPKYAEAHYFRGELYVAKGDQVNAAWDFRAAIDNAPTQKDPQVALDALGTFDKWYAAAQSAFSSSDLSAAVDAVSIARSINPKSYEAAMLHGRILDQRGQAADAVEAYTIALKIKPGDKAAKDALAAAQAAVKKGAK
jgi:Tfp pilus assembly protein PilF